VRIAHDVRATQQQGDFNMHCLSNLAVDRAREMADLFEASFRASEGEQEGRLIGRLALDLMLHTPVEERVICVAEDAGTLIGAIVFSRLRYPQDPRRVFVLAPVAVAPERQGQGIGQQLLRFGLDALRAAGVDVALTYGDPRFYAKLGFAPLREVDAQAPFPLQMPQGWLGQSLTAQPLMPLQGPSQCVAALNDPVFW
jgi:predicted N-acetyltransferase YhbS